MFSLMWFLSTYSLRYIKKLKTPLRLVWKFCSVAQLLKLAQRVFLLPGHYNVFLSASNLFSYQVTTMSEIAGNGNTAVKRYTHARCLGKNKGKLYTKE